jgi:hypothetical protein
MVHQFTDDPWVVMAIERTPADQEAEDAAWTEWNARHAAAEAMIVAFAAEDDGDDDPDPPAAMMQGPQWAAFWEAHRQLAIWRTRHSEAMTSARTYADYREVGRLFDAVAGANRRVQAALVELEAAFPDVDPADYLEVAA